MRSWWRRGHVTRAGQSAPCCSLVMRTAPCVVCTRTTWCAQPAVTGVTANDWWWHNSRRCPSSAEGCTTHSQGRRVRPASWWAAKYGLCSCNTSYTNWQFIIPYCTYKHDISTKWSFNVCYAGPTLNHYWVDISWYETQYRIHCRESCYMTSFSNLKPRNHLCIVKVIILAAIQYQW